MKYKVGQKVYYYLSYGDYTGSIVEGTIVKAIKDLSTKKTVYTVKTECNWVWDTRKDLTADYLYPSRKAIEKEYKEEIVYNNLHKRIDELEKLLSQVYAELTKDEHKGLEGMTLQINGETQFKTLKVQAEDVDIEGIGSLKKEFEKLKKEIAKIKKAIKPKTKKPVEKEKDAN